MQPHSEYRIRSLRLSKSDVRTEMQVLFSAIPTADPEASVGAPAPSAALHAVHHGLTVVDVVALAVVDSVAVAAAAVVAAVTNEKKQ